MLHKSIAEILRERGVITEAQKQEYELASRAENISFEVYVSRFEKVSDLDLAHAFAFKFELPLVERVTEKMADPQLLARVPLHFLRKNVVMPVRRAFNDEEKIVFLTSNPFDFQPLDELVLLLGKEDIAVAPRNALIEGINRFYPLEGTKEMIAELSEDSGVERALDFGEIHEDDIMGMASEAPIIKLVNHILYQAVKREASDIHIEPFEKEVRVRYRIDGILYTTLTPPKRLQAALSSRIKIMANLNIAEKRQPQDGRIQIKIADKPIDIRVSVLPVVFGECIVMRLLDKTKTFGQLTTLGLTVRDFGVLTDAIAQPNGIILITGPTGSGKTSTLYSILSELNKPGVNIVTVEDPVEYQMMGINQVQVKEQIGLTFAAALRSILRQDPDIVMIGETRDQETAQIAVQAALTGHLVLSTLHTNSAAASITRLIDMGVEPFLIASTITIVVAQRLVRRLCKACKKAYTPDAALLRKIGISDAEARSAHFFEPVGCEECSGTGYRGRLAIFEVMKMSPALVQLTLTRADATLIQDQARKDGMILLVEDGARKAREGLTTIEEVLAAATL